MTNNDNRFPRKFEADCLTVSYGAVGRRTAPLTLGEWFDNAWELALLKFRLKKKYKAGNTPIKYFDIDSCVIDNGEYIIPPHVAGTPIILRKSDDY